MYQLLFHSNWASLGETGVGAGTWTGSEEKLMGYKSILERELLGTSGSRSLTSGIGRRSRSSLPLWFLLEYMYIEG